ncbi:helix-turn-helix domain-containing protein [Pseudorhodoferax sp. Leaf274]|uniref:AraC family transcriptional regulator n=1 Tax=Pseudorhodoferax sp. Leaf274 TaxID=1736318 RepID=UPI00070332BE|nr:helix-turn-helix domain-containing protein [Pseudorhodoferax sp. Leaf274]KQP37345.1 hypothetical protein ASF44_13360 [Pseudorhodoferax sp. Leaf274]
MPSSSTPLLFGNNACRHFEHTQAFSDAVHPLWPHLQGLDGPAHPDRFKGRLAIVQLPGMSMLAASINALRVQVSDNSQTSIAFPVHGHSRLRIDRQQMDWGQGSGCLFVPAGSGPQQADSREQNVLMLQVDRRALDTAARAVRGIERGHPVQLGCDDPRILDAATNASSLALARHIGASIDLYARNPRLLHRLGLQDFVCRQLVLLFRPDWQQELQQQRLPDGAQRRRAIDRVCDAMLADLSGRFTVSDLSELSGMSVRGLQYAFQSRFGQSPMQWFRDQRLEHVRHRLLAGAPGSIAQMALDCGFPTSSTFSAFYRRRYGESPSATRLRAGLFRGRA